MEADLKAALLGAYARLLGPLVRILLRNGVSYLEFAETAKRVFVKPASQERDGLQRASPSQVAIRTGLTREEAERILNERQERTYDSNLGRITRVLTAWHTDAAYTGPYGLPLELEFENADRTDFASLVRAHCPDTSPVAMLDELIRIGA